MAKTDKQKMKELIEKLTKSLSEHPDEWEATEYTLIHLKSSVELWMASDRLFFQVYKPEKIQLPFFKAWGLYSIARKLWDKRAAKVNKERLNENYKIIKGIK